MRDRFDTLACKRALTVGPTKIGNLAVQAALPATPVGLRASALLYFGLAAACVASCIVAYSALQRLRLPARIRVHGDGVCHDGSVAPLKITDCGAWGYEVDFRSLGRLLRLIWREAASVFIVYVVTLAMYVHLHSGCRGPRAGRPFFISSGSIRCT